GGGVRVQPGGREGQDEQSCGEGQPQVPLRGEVEVQVAASQVGGSLRAAGPGSVVAAGRQCPQPGRPALQLGAATTTALPIVCIFTMGMSEECPGCPSCRSCSPGSLPASTGSCCRSRSPCCSR